MPEAGLVASLPWLHARMRQSISPVRTGVCLHALLAFFLWLGVAMPASASDIGEEIYRNGKLSSGSPLRGQRLAGIGVEGVAAACVTCHRPSGLGSTEGRTVIPPIIGKYLFRPHATNVHDMNLPHVAGYSATREPYTPASLAQAIRGGIAPGGRHLSDLMPRYALDEASMTALIAYLSKLGADAVPGVTEDVLHFATIITPDADPLQRKGMLEVLGQFFEDKNAFIRGGVRPMQTSREIEYRVSRRWQLHVWELSGPPSEWEAQLADHLAAEPVFAVISGLGGKDWGPIHHFCEQARLPCLLPNIELPVTAESDFYPVYFSRGVLLEADLMKHRIDEMAAKGSLKRVIQLFRRGDIGEKAAKQLEAGLRGTRLKIDNRMLGENSGEGLSLNDALKGNGEHDLLVLWLRGSDLAALPTDLAITDRVMMSGLMGGLEHAPIGPNWRKVALMTYPFDLPDLRKVRMNYPLGWFKVRHIDVVAERVQSDTYLACGILAETLNDMLDSFVREYLVERIEVMLSHRLISGYYPRLGLSQGQRFASKGGYLVHFDGIDDKHISADGDWIVP